MIPKHILAFNKQRNPAVSMRSMGNSRRMIAFEDRSACFNAPTTGNKTKVLISNGKQHKGIKEERIS